MKVNDIDGPVDLGNLPIIIKELVSELAMHAKQGASDTEWMDAQAMCVVEEAGEFIGAYRRWRGFARRPGSADDVENELADVIISTSCMIQLWLIMNGSSGETVDSLETVVARKLDQIFSRGWINKDSGGHGLVEWTDPEDKSWRPAS